LGYSCDELLAIKISWDLDRTDAQSQRIGAGGIPRHSLFDLRQGSQSEKP